MGLFMGRGTIHETRRNTRKINGYPFTTFDFSRTFLGIILGVFVKIILVHVDLLVNILVKLSKYINISKFTSKTN